MFLFILSQYNAISIVTAFWDYWYEFGVGRTALVVNYTSVNHDALGGCAATLLSLIPAPERLRYFLVLEEAQVCLYASQQRLISDPVLYRALGHFRDVESEHVRNLEKVITQRGGKPSRLTSLAGPMARFIGNMAGSMGISLMLQLNLLIEQRAAQEYRLLIAETQSPALKNILWKHMIDEEMHRTWFESTLLHLTKKRTR
jgi:bacterioferritin